MYDSNSSIAAPTPNEYSYNAKRQQPPAQTGTSREKYGVKFVAYGGKCAFQVSGSDSSGEKNTINIESAHKCFPNNPENKKLDWNNKIVFQLTINELPVFIAVVYGFLPAVRFDSHGACNSKFLEVIHQKGNYFFKMGAKDNPMKVAPVSFEDAMHFGMVALSQYRKNFPGLSSESVMQSIKILVKRLYENNKIKLPRNSQN